MTSPLIFISRIPPQRTQAPAPAAMTLSLHQEQPAPQHRVVAELAPSPGVATVLGPRCPMVRLGRLVSGIGCLRVETGTAVEEGSVAWETADGRSGTLAQAPLDPSRRAVVSLAKPGTALVIGLRWVRQLRRVLVALDPAEHPVSVQVSTLPAALRVDPETRVVELYVDAGEVVLRASNVAVDSWSEYDIAR